MLFGHLIEFPFLELCFRLDAVDFLVVRFAAGWGHTICFTCSGVRPGDVGCRVICAGGVVALLVAIAPTTGDRISRW